MSTPRIPKPAVLFLSILAAEWEHREDLLGRLCDHFGALQYSRGPFPFTRTSYYDEELGTPISRMVLAFDRLLPHDELAAAKLFTNELEQRYARPDGSRVFNLDPGLLSLERLVLATGKNYTHRIYLGRGIWGDLTLIYKEGDWRSMEWTFPDYADPQMQKHLTLLRERYKSAVQTMQNPK